jgi:hypothetical protein
MHKHCHCPTLAFNYIFRSDHEIVWPQNDIIQLQHSRSLCRRLQLTAGDKKDTGRICSTAFIWWAHLGDVCVWTVSIVCVWTVSFVCVICLDVLQAGHLQSFSSYAIYGPDILTCSLHPYTQITPDITLWTNGPQIVVRRPTGVREVSPRGPRDYFVVLKLEG